MSLPDNKLTTTGINNIHHDIYHAATHVDLIRNNEENKLTDIQQRLLSQISSDIRTIVHNIEQLKGTL